MRLRTTITLHDVAKDFINSYLNSIPTISQDLTCFFHSLKDRRYKEYLVKLSDRISKMKQQKSFKLIEQERQFRSRGARNQSHYREVPWWEIFLEQELRFGLYLGRLALLKKTFGHFWRPVFRSSHGQNKLN